MTSDISLLLVFSAGLLSFLSPCVLPLIPSYFSILGGVGFGRNHGTEAMNEATSLVGQVPFKPRLLKAALAFVIGFSTP